MMNSDTEAIMNEYDQSLNDAAEAIAAGISTPNQNLKWLISLSETWVRETLEGVA